MTGCKFLGHGKQVFANPEPQPVLEFTNDIIPVQCRPGDHQLALVRPKPQSRLCFILAINDIPCLAQCSQPKAVGKMGCREMLEETPGFSDSFHGLRNPVFFSVQDRRNLALIKSMRDDNTKPFLPRDLQPHVLGFPALSDAVFRNHCFHRFFQRNAFYRAVSKLDLQSLWMAHEGCILELLHKKPGYGKKKIGLDIALEMPVRKAKFTAFFDNGCSDGRRLRFGDSVVYFPCGMGNGQMDRLFAFIDKFRRLQPPALPMTK